MGRSLYCDWHGDRQRHLSGSHDMILRVGTPGWVFVVWIFGGLLTLAGALSYAELAAAIPEAGGEYAYLREAYGRCGISI